MMSPVATRWQRSEDKLVCWGKSRRRRRARERSALGGASETGEEWDLEHWPMKMKGTKTHIFKTLAEVQYKSSGLKEGS